MNVFGIAWHEISTGKLEAVSKPVKSWVVVWEHVIHPESIPLKMGWGRGEVEEDLQRGPGGFTEGQRWQSLWSVAELLMKHVKGFSDSSLRNQRIVEF